MANLFLEKNASTDVVVETFLNFFQKHNHLYIKNASIVPQNDPTLLFINSGMAPLKSFFLGVETPPQSTLCNVQSCIRTNDIEEVGDRHHLTCFEMLGSWSIGAYWKEQAISLAFELLTQGFGFPADKLYATVFAGDDKHNAPPDTESTNYWMTAGLPVKNIVPLGEDNFWGPAGEFGPCGPCTEVYFDTGAEFGPEYVPGGHFDDKGRYIEIWNAGVFMQYDMQKDGLHPLAIQSVDTGSGLERMVMTLNRYNSVYEVDTMAPLITIINNLVGKLRSERDAKIICDHSRALVNILSQGVTPCNTGRGYVPRRLLRRSLAILAQSDIRQISLMPIIDGIYNDLKPWSLVTPSSYDVVTRTIKEESELFLRTLDRGIKTLSSVVAQGSSVNLTGRDAFNMFSTFGLPLDTIRDYVEEQGGTFDNQGFNTAYLEHQRISRGEEKEQNVSTGVVKSLPQTIFEGHESTFGHGEIVAIIQNKTELQQITPGEKADIVIDRTVFYPTSGGQVGDVGTLKSATGSATVETTYRLSSGHITHTALLQEGTLQVGDTVDLEVDKVIRQGRSVHHSATHLLNAALRETLGGTIEQRGSLVTEDRLRFDFTHEGALNESQLQQVEAQVNRWIQENVLSDIRLMSREAAAEEGAIGLFTEKYQDTVRMVSFGDFSKELCFGTHVHATGELGLFLITSEKASSRGIRRITASANVAAMAKSLKKVSSSPSVGQNRLAAKDSSGQDAPGESSRKRLNLEQLKSKVEHLDGVPFLLLDDLDGSDDVVNIVTSASKMLSAITCGIQKSEKGVRLGVAVPEPLLPRITSSQILSELTPLVNGKGAGKPQFAMGGGPLVAGAGKVASEAKHIIQRLLAAQSE